MPEFEGSEKGRSLISAFRSLAITASTPGFKKLSTALTSNLCKDGLHADLPDSFPIDCVRPRALK